MTKTTAMSPAEIAHVQALWATPLQQKIAARNMIVAAVRAAMVRTGQRLGWSAVAGGIAIDLSAMTIGANGMPTGTANTQSLVSGLSADQAVAFLTAYEG